MTRKSTVTSWRRLVGSATAATAVLGILGTPPALAATPVLVVDGRGWGHGVGMAQDGAYWMGKSGASTAEILAHFYPGTTISHRQAEVRVAVGTAAGPGSDLVIGFPSGGEVRDALSGPQSPGFPVAIAPGGSVTVGSDGAGYHVHSGSGGPAAAPAAADQPAPAAEPPPPAAASPAPDAGPPPMSIPPTAAASAVAPGDPPADPDQPRDPPPPPPPPPPTTTTPPPPPPSPTPKQAPPAHVAAGSEASSSRPLWAVPRGGSVVELPARGHRYRGAIEAVQGGRGGGLRLVNQLDVEQYLRGMGEVRDPGWPTASLGAQATAARTYALRAMAHGGELCDDDRCQVYLGQAVEYPAMDKAIADTAGQVVTFGDELADTVYSANAGGISATPAEGFGSGGAGNGAFPYLPAVPYETHDPDPWLVRIGLGDLGARLGYAGQLGAARVAESGPSGRALSVALDGSAGAVTVDAHRFASALGLRSTLFNLGTDLADAVPAPPAPGDLIQQSADAAADAASSPVDDPWTLSGMVPTAVRFAAQLPAGLTPTLHRTAHHTVRGAHRRLFDIPWTGLTTIVVATVVLRSRLQAGITPPL